MKIAILTYHYVDNYGAVLQALALQKYLCANNEVVILNYNNTKQRSLTRPLYNRIKSSLWEWFKLFFGLNKRHQSFEQFRNKYLNLTEELTSKEALERFYKDNSLDCVIVGSDQVWNPSIHGFDNSYLLDFVYPIKKVSYAASMGKTITDSSWIKDLCSNVNSYSSVSVRESYMKDYLGNAGVHKRIYVVPDPVFLLPHNEWLELAIKPIIENYILCYIMPGDKSIEQTIFEYANTLANENNLKVVFVGLKEYRKCVVNGKDINSSSPLEFLGLINNAKLVLTNSFHGTAFSIIMNTPFYSFVNNGLGNNNQLSSRIVSLLSELGIKNNLVDVAHKSDSIFMPALSLDENDYYNFIVKGIDYLNNIGT